MGKKFRRRIARRIRKLEPVKGAIGVGQWTEPEPELPEKVG